MKQDEVGAFVRCHVWAYGPLTHKEFKAQIEEAAFPFQMYKHIKLYVNCSVFKIDTFKYAIININVFFKHTYYEYFLNALSH